MSTAREEILGFIETFWQDNEFLKACERALGFLDVCDHEPGRALIGLGDDVKLEWDSESFCIVVELTHEPGASMYYTHKLYPERCAYRIWFAWEPGTDLPGLPRLVFRFFREGRWI